MRQGAQPKREEVEVGERQTRGEAVGGIGGEHFNVLEEAVYVVEAVKGCVEKVREVRGVG